jgi:hypothetical protein
MHYKDNTTQEHSWEALPWSKSQRGARARSQAGGNEFRSGGLGSYQECVMLRMQMAGADRRAGCPMNDQSCCRCSRAQRCVGGRSRTPDSPRPCKAAHARFASAQRLRISARRKPPRYVPVTRKRNASIAGRHRNREVDPQHGARVSTRTAEEQGRVSVGSQAAEGSLAAAAGMRFHNADQEAEG